MNSDSAAVANGNSFTTPVITTNTDYYAAVYADDNKHMPYSFGPPATLTGGFGNFTNGMWFSVLKPMTLDSISVYLQRFGELPSSLSLKAAVIRRRVTAELN